MSAKATTLYGIKFTGPRRKNIWWRKNGPHSRGAMTFANINDACKWSAEATQMFPHCKYLVMEYRHEKAQAKSP